MRKGLPQQSAWMGWSACPVGREKRSKKRYLDTRTMNEETSK
jgi:hypothetical protein